MGARIRGETGWGSRDEMGLISSEWEKVEPPLAFAALGLTLILVPGFEIGGVSATLVGSVVTLAALVVASWHTGALLIQRTSNARLYLGSLIRIRDANYDRVSCSEAELRYLCDAGRRAIGNVCPTFENVLPRFHANREIVTAFRRGKSGATSEFCGYFIVYPLTSRADDMIVEGELDGGPAIRAHHLCHRFANASALYIAMIWGVDRKARGVVVYALREFLKKAMTYKRVRRVYGNATTPDGSRLLAASGFVPLRSGSSIQVLNVTHTEAVHDERKRVANDGAPPMRSARTSGVMYKERRARRRINRDDRLASGAQGVYKNGD